MLGRTSKVHDRRLDVLKSLRPDKFERPIDIGGYDASHHSADLRWLASKGLVIKERTPTWVRPQYHYKRSEKGTEYVRNSKKN